MLVELGIGILLATAAYRASRPQPGVVTPTMRAIFTHAVNKRNPPVPAAELLKLADILDDAQLPAYSELLRKRAALALRSPELKDKHRAAYRKAMSSTDPLQMRVAATAFESMGMTGCAANLRNQAAALDAATLASAMSVAPVTAPVPAEPDPITDPSDTGDVPVSPDPAPGGVPSGVMSTPTSAPTDVASSVGTQDNLASAEIDQALSGNSIGDETGVDPDNRDLDDFITFGTNGPTPLTPDAPVGGVTADGLPSTSAPSTSSTGPTIDTPDGPAPMPSGLSPEAVNAGFTSEAEYQEFTSGQAA